MVWFNEVVSERGKCTKSNEKAKFPVYFDSIPCLGLCNEACSALAVRLPDLSREAGKRIVFAALEFRMPEKNK